ATGLYWKSQRTREIIFVSAALLFAFGVILTGLVLVERIRETRDKNKTSFTEFRPQSVALDLGPVNDPTRLAYQKTPLQYFTWARRLSLKQPTAGIPAFGIYLAIILILLLFNFLVLAPIPSKGLHVHLLQPTPPMPGTDKWTDPLVVR